MINVKAYLLSAAVGLYHTVICTMITNIIVSSSNWYCVSRHITKRYQICIRSIHLQNCEAISMFSQVKGTIKSSMKSVMFARILKVHPTCLLALER